MGTLVVQLFDYSFIVGEMLEYDEFDWNRLCEWKL